MIQYKNFNDSKLLAITQKYRNKKILIYYIMKLLSVVGTRPQFLKLAPLAISIREHGNIIHKIVHTGQHFDFEMSDELFQVLKIPQPDYLLKKVGSTSIIALSDMMIQIEDILCKENPDYVLVFGDCDSTLAGAIVANKLKIKLIHIEAGMRSYNKSMPEEVNRIMTDHISNILLCSTPDSIDNLHKENIHDNIYFVGNLQLELLQMCCKEYNDNRILLSNNLNAGDYSLLTIHRESNTNEVMLNKYFNELKELNTKIIFPMHPRTKKVIEKNNVDIPKNIIIIKPVNYLDMTMLLRNCKCVITDSGGIQPESWYLGKKCIILREDTEWLEPLYTNNNILYDYKTALNVFIENFMTVETRPVHIIENVSQLILKVIMNKNHEQ